MERLSATLRDYDWGSITAIPEFLGTPVTGTPHAEVWFGAHPAGSSRLTERIGQPELLDAITAAPHVLLGEHAEAIFGPRLPFLLKVIAPARPLSIQVHPDAHTARHGNQTGAVPYFEDPFHKPEMLVALAPFEILCGFRPASDTAAILHAFADAGVDEFLPYARMLSDAEQDASGTLRHVFAELAGTPPQAAENLVRKTVDAAAAIGGAARDASTVARRIAVHHPGDIGVVLSLMLRHARLAPGEAVFVDAGVIHCYVSGFGLEIMASSDNVLRAGLTSKSIDIPALVAITDFTPRDIPRVTASVAGSTLTYAPAVPEFALHLVTAERTPVNLEPSGPRIVLGIEGTTTLSDGTTTRTLARGEAVYIPPTARSLTILPSQTTSRVAIGTTAS